ncbi:hypothetical protein HPB50_022001 [Hyalomma asiaticum]|uniref:Uncharacterized protein n=1 Tax=Hyalomma asiaticum TaxID=266040 RepID=A0ACB7SAE9_HYAAI|nr:hypothetical protein HPB50_022001 [Hyalomma asiaticum]
MIRQLFASTIDYALATAKLAARIAQVHIDEDSQFSLGSDHNRIRLSFSRGGFRTGRRSPPPSRGMCLPSKSVERVAEDFENCPQRRKCLEASESLGGLQWQHQAQIEELQKRLAAAEAKQAQIVSPSPLPAAEAMESETGAPATDAVAALEGRRTPLRSVWTAASPSSKTKSRRP